MKRRCTLFLLAAVLLVFSTSASAALIKGDIAKGPIVSIDTVKGQLVVNDGRSGKEVSYSVPAGMLSGLQRGQVVIVRSEKNVVKSIRLAPGRSAPAPAPVVTPAPTKAAVTTPAAGSNQTPPPSKRY